MKRQSVAVDGLRIPPGGAHVAAVVLNSFSLKLGRTSLIWRFVLPGCERTK